MIDHPTHYLEKGIGSVEDILTALMMDEENLRRFAADAPVLTDDFNRMATESATAMEREETLRFSELVELSLPYDPRLQTDGWVHQGYSDRSEFRVHRRAVREAGYKRHAVDLANTLEAAGSPESLLLIGMGLKRQGEDLESQRVLFQAFMANPQDSQSRFALLRPWLSRLDADDTPGYVSDIAATVSGSEAAVVAGWKAAREETGKPWSSSIPGWRGSAQRINGIWNPSSYARTGELRSLRPSMQPRLAREAKRLIDNAIAIFQDPDLYNMRVAAAFVAGDAIDVIETARRLLHVFDLEVNNAIAGRVDVPPSAIDLKLRQIEAVRSVVDQMRRDHNIPAYKTDDLDRELRNIIRRLERLKAD